MTLVESNPDNLYKHYAEALAYAQARLLENAYANDIRLELEIIFGHFPLRDFKSLLDDARHIISRASG